MAMFDVYVEGATDPSPQAVQRLAEVMSQRYGLPAAELVTRLAKGRFRVKANIDEATAQTYAKDLEAVGARVTIAEARASVPPSRPTPQSPANERAAALPPPSRAKKPTNSPGAYSMTAPKRSGASTPPPIAGRTTTSSLPPSNQARPQPGALLPPRTTTSSLPPSNQPYSSGLAAAFHEDTPLPEMGALDKLSVASLDDGPDKPTIDPSPSLPASIGPATAKPAAKAEKPKDEPVDLFAPPDAQGEEFKVELAADEVEHREARKKAATPPAAVPVAPANVPPSSPVLRKKPPTIQPLSERQSGVRLPSAVIDDTPRWRFAAGVLAAVVLGFVPATCVQSCREESAFRKIDEHVATVQTQAASNSSAAPVPFAQLDAFREEQLAKKKSDRRNIALVSMLIWALGGAGIGYVWFRRVPWDKIKFGS